MLAIPVMILTVEICPVPGRYAFLDTFYGFSSICLDEVIHLDQTILVIRDFIVWCPEGAGTTTIAP